MVCWTNAQKLKIFASSCPLKCRAASQSSTSRHVTKWMMLGRVGVGIMIGRYVRTQDEIKGVCHDSATPRLLFCDSRVYSVAREDDPTFWPQSMVAEAYTLKSNGSRNLNVYSMPTFVCTGFSRAAAVSAMPNASDSLFLAFASVSTVDTVLRVYKTLSIAVVTLISGRVRLPEGSYRFIGSNEAYRYLCRLAGSRRIPPKESGVVKRPTGML